MIRVVVSFALLLAGAAGASEPAGVDAALQRLTRDGKFSGAVVIRDARGVRFARGYGMADPFSARAFTPDTPVDSGSLAKPVTAAAVLLLARDGRIDLDARAARYLREMPSPEITIRQLLSHSAGFAGDGSPEALAGKTNLQLLQAARPLLFRPGTAFTYCNVCTLALAEIVERVSRQHYLSVARARVALPRAVSLRPGRLADWRGRAIGYGRDRQGRLQRADSYEGEIFYGPANLSISAAQLAEWGSRWWHQPLAAIRHDATAPATIGGNTSGLTLGNWYCAKSRTRCHYLGHHEGFHHMLYWDAQRRISVAMMTNNSMEPALHQRVQRALVAFAENRPDAAARELAQALPTEAPALGSYRLGNGEVVEVRSGKSGMVVLREGIEYPAYPVAQAVRYVPGLDLYLGGAGGGRLHWLTLYEDLRGEPQR